MSSFSVKTPDYIVHGFGQKLKNVTLTKQDFMVKGISRGAEWRKFQPCSEFRKRTSKNELNFGQNA